MKGHLCFLRELTHEEIDAKAVPTLWTTLSTLRYRCRGVAASLA